MAQIPRLLELRPLPLFNNRCVPNSPAPPPQPLHHVPPRQPLRQPRRIVRIGIHRSLGAALCPLQIPRIGGYVFHCDSQEAPHLFALVSSYYRVGVLLAFVCDQIPRGDFLCGDELFGAWDHVWVLLSYGDKDEAQMVECHVYYYGAD